MKIGKYDFTFKNAKKYASAKLRKFIINNPSEAAFIEPHILEQIEERKLIADPLCISQGYCKICNCETPDLFYADESCEGNCYPEMMDKETWEKYKNKNKNNENS